MSVQKITVTIEGPQGVGKTRIADLIEDALCNSGADVNELVPPGTRATWRQFGSEIHITEKQVD